jgi:hypothetical protein
MQNSRKTGTNRADFQTRSNQTGSDMFMSVRGIMGYHFGEIMRVIYIDQHFLINNLIKTSYEFHFISEISSDCYYVLRISVKVK